MVIQNNTGRLDWDSLIEKERYSVSIDGFNSLSRKHLKEVIETGLRGKDPLPRNYHGNDDKYGLFVYVYKSVNDSTRQNIASVLKESLQNLTSDRSRLEEQIEKDSQSKSLYGHDLYINNLFMLTLFTIPYEVADYTASWITQNKDLVFSKLGDKKWEFFIINMLQISLHHQPPLNREFLEPFLFNYPGLVTSGMFKISLEEGLYSFDKLLKNGFKLDSIEQLASVIMYSVRKRYGSESVKKTIIEHSDRIDKLIVDYLINWLKENETA